MLRLLNAHNIIYRNAKFLAWCPNSRGISRKFNSLDNLQMTETLLYFSHSVFFVHKIN